MQAARTLNDTECKERASFMVWHHLLIALSLLLIDTFSFQLISIIM